VITFSISEIFNIVVMSILFTLGIYHLIVYLRRNDRSEKYYITFTLFAVTMLIYLLFTTDLRRFIWPSKIAHDLFSPPITCTTYILFQIFGAQTLKVLFNFKFTRRAHEIPFYLPFFIQFLFMLTNFYFGYDYYMKNIFIFTAISASIGPIYIITCLIHWVFKNNLFKDVVVKIVFGGWIFLAIDFLFEELFPCFGFNYPLKSTYLGLSLIHI
jgi:hypothetical protein